MMNSSFINPLTCGFAKGIAYHLSATRSKVSKENNESNSQYKARIFQQQYTDFNKIFQERSDAFNVNYNLFTENIQSLKQKIQKWGREKADKKRAYLETFSS